MISKTPYLDQPCERCGSKKTLINIKKKSPTLTITMQIEYSQIICTNKACQKEFEDKLAEKRQKEELIRLKREENKAARLAS